MTKDELMALADDYASSHNAHTIHRLKETRATLSAAIEALIAERDAWKESAEEQVELLLKTAAERDEYKKKYEQLKSLWRRV